ncbi:hypothetical protein GYMLUDRAFT_240631 [Collybiopsis luxurians FD-317 M1]|nr:hypothetical protein GYMLUDRAFT_240631 [Collybiopsis luxurians FD-317 M1]
MSRSNTRLAMYLHTVNGFYYPSLLIVRGAETLTPYQGQMTAAGPLFKSNIPAIQHTSRLQMLVHRVIAGLKPKEYKESPKFKFRDWVVIKGGVHDGDLGLCCLMDDRNNPEFVPLLIVPCIPRTEANYDVITNSGGRLNEDLELGDCIDPLCYHPRPEGFTCAHPREFKMGSCVFECGLLRWEAKAKHLHHAPSTIDPDTFLSFVKSRHPEVRVSFNNMPVPSTWNFHQGESVYVVEPFGDKYTGLLLPKDRHGALGIIKSVGDRTCNVAFDQELFAIPSVLLAKYFNKMDSVFVAGSEITGRVLELNLSQCSASLFLNEETQKLLKQERDRKNKENFTSNNFFVGEYSLMDMVLELPLNVLQLAPTMPVFHSKSSSSGSLLQLSAGVAVERSQAPLVADKSRDYRTRRSPWIGLSVFVAKHPVR